MGACADVPRNDNQDEASSPILFRLSKRPTTRLLLEGKELPSGDYSYFSREQQVFYAQELILERQSRELAAPKYWETQKLIGWGASGSVTLGVRQTGELVAVKQILLGNLKNDPEKVKKVQDEVYILSQLSHPNIVCYLGSEMTTEALKIIMEHVGKYSLEAVIKKFGRLPESLIQRYAQQILQGLEYLHAHEIVHRDIKSANVLVTAEGTCKLADFGCSKQKLITDEVSQFTSCRGTPRWMAPEVIRQQKHRRFADIWSFGCLMVEMATGELPWADIRAPFMIRKRVCDSDALPDVSMLSPTAEEFVHQCFRREPWQRPNVCDLLNHPFIKKPAHFTLGSVELDNTSGLSTARSTGEESLAPASPEHNLNGPFSQFIDVHKAKKLPN